MLLSFKMKNVYSFKEESGIVMYAPSNQVKNRYEDNYTSICGYDILKTAIIVGENAGGKSNFIKGIKYFQSFFEKNQRIRTNLMSIFRVNLLKDVKSLVDAKGRQQFEILIASEEKNIVYKYALTLGVNGIEHEELSTQTQKNKEFKIIFSVDTVFRAKNVPENDTTPVAEVKVYVPSLEKSNYDRLTESVGANERTGLWVNTFALLSIPNTADFIDEVKKIYINNNDLDLPLNLYCQVYDEKLVKNNIPILKTQEYLEIFRLIDSSICKIMIDEERPLSSTIIVRKYGSEESNREILLESSGVKQYFVFALILYKVIYENMVTFADEMDSMFNPVLTAKVVNYLHVMGKYGQLVFTTHNVFNMSFKLFMKEQMYITSKNKKTLESSLYSVSKFKDLRYDSNEKIYEYYMMGLLGGAGGDNECLYTEE